MCDLTQIVINFLCCLYDETIIQNKAEINCLYPETITWMGSWHCNDL